MRAALILCGFPTPPALLSAHAYTLFAQDVRGDIFAFGLCMLELLTLKQLDPQHCMDVPQLLHQVHVSSYCFLHLDLLGVGWEGRTVRWQVAGRQGRPACTVRGD